MKEKATFITDEIVDAIRKRTASTTVGPATVRNMGKKGLAKKARELLCKTKIEKFRVNNKKEFNKALNRETGRIKRGLVKGEYIVEENAWGVSRKILNIYLRGLMYNRYTCNHYKLYGLEKLLELPLDSHIAKALKKSEQGKKLPRFKGVVHVNKEINSKYQQVAQEIAKQKNIARIHLDAIWWRGDKKC